MCDKSLFFFILAFFLYALWGSPTPNNPDWVEAIIAVCLIAAVGLPSIFKNFILFKSQRDEYWCLAVKIFFLFGLSVPALIGVVQGNDVGIIIRDLIAFIFLCMPLFLYNYMTQTKVRMRVFFGLCLLVGLLFSIRVLVPHFLLFRNTTELLYLANSPLVLMCALFLAGQAGYWLYQKISVLHFIKAFGYLSLCAIPIMAMFVDLQRASFAALVLSFISLVIIGFVKSPSRIIAPVLIILSVSFLFYDYGVNLLGNVGEKTAQVGLNMRLQELQAVWAQASHSAWTIFFGQGWGAQFSSPAVGNLNVSYTHSLMSYIFFKMGVIGLCLCLVYLYFIFEKWTRLYFSNPVKGNALIWPFMIPIFLYASHKSFDFGVLLTLILVLSTRGEGQKNVA